MCDGCVSGRVSFSRIDTAPGSGGLLAPGARWRGDAHAYRAVIRERYRSCPAYRVQVAVAARFFASPRAVEVRVTGPYAEEARQVLEALRAPPRAGGVGSGGGAKVLAGSVRAGRAPVAIL